MIGLLSRYKLFSFFRLEKSEGKLPIWLLVKSITSKFCSSKDFYKSGIIPRYS